MMNYKMKLTHVGLLLGSSYMASAAEIQVGGAVEFGDNTKTLQFTADKDLDLGTGLHLWCEKDYASGTAKHSYADLKSITGTELTGDGHAPAELAKFDSQTKLAYYCGVTESSNADSTTLLDISNAPSGVTMKDGNKVLVKFDGGATGCSDKGTLALAFQDVANKGTLTGGTFDVAIKSTLTFDCRKAQAFTASVSADLRVKKKAAATFIAADASAKTQELSRSSSESGTGGDIYEADWQPSYNLGTAAPHSKYYESGGCVGGGDLCFGALKTASAQASQGADQATSLAAASWAGDASVTYHKFSDTVCSTTALSASGQVTEWEACQLSEATATGSDGLLTAFDCPFIQGTSLSTSDAVTACKAAGESQSIVVTCQSSTKADGTGLEAKDVALGDPDFTAKVELADPSGIYFKPEPTTTTTAAGDASLSKSVQSGTATVDWVLPLTAGNGDITVASELRIEEIGGTFQSTVVLDGTDLKFTAPARSMNVKLTGLVMTSCSSARVDIMTLEAAAGSKYLIVQSSTQASGSFVSLGACDGRWEYQPANGLTGMKVVGVHAPGKGAAVGDIKFCKAGKQSKGDCLSDLPADPAAQGSDGKAVISKLCDTTASGNVGGLVEFEDGTGSRDYFYAPVYCPGPCGTSNVKPVILDWTVEFEASVVDGSNLNLVTANQVASRYDGSAADLSRSAFLSDSNVCGANGRVIGAVDSNVTGAGCGIMDQPDNAVAATKRYFDKATDIQSKFQSCGNTASEDPEVYLVQQVHVDLAGETDDEYFCHAQKLKLEVKEMTNQATATLAQIEAHPESEALAAFDASIRSLAYEECSGGGYKLVTKLDIDSSLVTGAVTYTADANQPAKFLPAALAGTSDLLTFEGASCVDVCAEGNENFYSSVFSFGGDLASAGGSSLAIDFSVQVLGSPCTATQEIGQGQVTLSLFGKSGTARDIQRSGATVSLIDESAVNCDATGESLGNGEVAVGDSLCASLGSSNFGSSSLKVLGVSLTRKSPGSIAEVITGHNLFTVGDEFTGSDSAAKYGSAVAVGHELVFADAFSEYTLTVDWEQKLSARRLRSVHVFGAADHEVSAKLSILPVAAQIADVAEGDVLSEEVHNDAAPTPSATSSSSDDEFEWGSVGGVFAIIGIVLGSGFVLALVRSMQRYGDLTSTPLAIAQGRWDDANRPDRKVYNKVRRSERFTINNF